MRPPAIVSNPFPAQTRPWVHRCAKHGCRMVPNERDGGIHCPVCAVTRDLSPLGGGPSAA